MDNRTEKILLEVSERTREAMRKQASLVKRGSSILDETGGIMGGTLGGVTGMTGAAMLTQGLPARYRLLASILGGTGTAVAGAMGGSALGQMMADKRRHKNYQEVLEDANMNRLKALQDATAMRAFGNAGLARGPYAT